MYLTDCENSLLKWYIKYCYQVTKFNKIPKTDVYKNVKRLLKDQFN